MELDIATPPNGTPIIDQGDIPVQASAAALYTPSGSKSALISSIHLYNTNTTTAQVVNLYIGGVAAGNQIAAISIPASGWATYEDGTGWTAYAANGVAESTAGLISVSSYIGSTVAVGATTFTNITSVSLSPGTWLIYGSVMSHLTTATLGHQDVFLGPTTASKTGAYVAASNSIGDIAGGVEECSLDVITVQTFTTQTTVFLETYSSEATTVEPTSTEQTIANCSGILAVKIG